MAELKLQQSRLDGRYDIINCLGRGSYAEIYVARDNAATQGAPSTVVIKALNTSLQDVPDEELERTLVANFQNEAVALDRVRHPHIISRLGHGTAIDLGGMTFHYIVLEYLPGGDMAALSRNHRLPLAKVLLYLEQVCSGLIHAHNCGVIHRDIKPQNLLLSADQQVVKIADFGVARFEATEGAITRVGTNIYSAPEHNPLVQTGYLEGGVFLSSRDHVTPAADIYSLAKMTYTLLAGESPRRFAQHPVTQLPETINGEYWSAAVLRVLQKATQTLPGNRYQTVEAFWDEIADAALAPTQPLTMQVSDIRRTPSSELKLKRETTAAPPRPSFEPAAVPANSYESAFIRRPRIVVPIAAARAMAPSSQSISRHRPAKDVVATMPDDPKNGKPLPRRPVTSASRPKRFLVALALILAFSGMLLATHKYVTSHWNPLEDIPKLGDVFVVGREGVTTTDVNLRQDASATNPPIGLAENNSRVKVLSINNNWYEVQVLEHGRVKTDPYTSDRGWINKKFVRFD